MEQTNTVRPYRFSSAAEQEAFQCGVEAMRQVAMRAIPQVQHTLQSINILSEIVGCPKSSPIYTAHDLAMAEGYANEQGVTNAHAGIHEVLQDENADALPGVPEELPVCRVFFYEDRGDPSVGLQGSAYWALAKDQSGTALEQLLKRPVNAPEPA